MINNEYLESIKQSTGYKTRRGRRETLPLKV